MLDGLGYTRHERSRFFHGDALAHGYHVLCGCELGRESVHNADYNKFFGKFHSKGQEVTGHLVKFAEEVIHAPLVADASPHASHKAM